LARVFRAVAVFKTVREVIRGLVRASINNNFGPVVKVCTCMVLLPIDFEVYVLPHCLGHKKMLIYIICCGQKTTVLNVMNVRGECKNILAYLETNHLQPSKSTKSKSQDCLEINMRKT
jgi:hypothetical protein